MTDWVDEVATSHKTLLAITEQVKNQISLTPFLKGKFSHTLPWERPYSIPPRLFLGEGQGKGEYLFIINWCHESGMKVYAY